MNAEQLRERRTALGLSQAGLAGLLGVHRQTVAAWEQGRQVPPNMVDLALNWLEAESGLRPVALAEALGALGLTEDLYTRARHGREECRHCEAPGRHPRHAADCPWRLARELGETT